MTVHCTRDGCGFDTHSGERFIDISSVTRQSTMLGSVTLHAVSRELDEAKKKFNKKILHLYLNFKYSVK